MIAMLNFTMLVLATVLAAVAAVAFDWLLLRATCHLMRPVKALHKSRQPELLQGTVQLARAFLPHR